MSEYKVPLRISFTGLATDIPARIGRYTGIAVCAAIDKYVRVRITTNNHEPPFIYPECDLIDLILAKMPFEADIPRMQIRWESDVKIGSGLGVSSALLVAVARHFYKGELYQASIANEVELLKNGGLQDPVICAYEGCRVLSFRYDGFLISETLSTPDSDYFMLVDSGRRKDTSRQYVNHEPFGSEYMRGNKANVELAKCAIRGGYYQMLGECIRYVHKVKSQRTNYAIPYMDEFLSDALKNGAYGGKLCGAGGGGHFLLVINPDQRQKLIEIADYYGFSDVPFRFI